jgi:PEP-CTERM motif
MRASILAFAIAAASLTASNAFAATISWNTYSGSGSSLTSTSGTGNNTEMVFSSGGETLRARAFYINSNADKTGNMADPLKKATLKIYDQGLGVTSSGECGSCSPDHTTDNSGLKEMVIFQLPSDNWDPTAAILVPFGSPPDTDVTFFVGGTTAQFANLGAFEGKSLDQLLAAGFKQVDNTTDTTGTRTANIDAPTTTGRYLIVASWLKDETPDDYIKIKDIAAKQGGGTSVPEPGTLTLVAFGVGAMAVYRRRRLSLAG